MRYLMRRVLHSCAVLLVVSALSFVFTELAPGNFFDEMRLNPQISPDSVAKLKAKFGLEKPVALRYGKWLASVFRGEFGFSFAYGTPVSSLLWARAKNTLLLTSVATVFVWIIALVAGTLAAASPGKGVRRLIEVATSILLSAPDVLIALTLLMYAVRTRRFPAGGMMSPNLADLPAPARINDLISHLVLPVCALILASLAVPIRHVQAALSDSLSSPFMQAGRAHGIPRRRLLFCYALRSASGPLLSLFGLSIGGLLSASLFVEVIMAWPGIGALLFEAITARDVFVVVGAILFSAAFLVIGNLIADLLLYMTDPRIREPMV